MNLFLKEFLFNKNILVNDKNQSSDCDAVVVALANKLGIQVIEGNEKLNIDVFKYASNILGINIPKPFYTSFPESVLELTPLELKLDQLASYIVTYGLGDFSEARHSYFEVFKEVKVFNEEYTIKKFKVLYENEAISYLYELVNDMALNSRDLSIDKYKVVLTMFTAYNYLPKVIKSKSLITRLYLDTLNDKFITYMNLNDVIRLTSYIQNNYYNQFDFSPLNLKNTHRKIITNLIDKLTLLNLSINECYEKRKCWVILLHHIHYKPINENGKKLVNMMRGGKNNSAYSHMELNIKNNNIIKAVNDLILEKGNGEVIRHLDYFLSRANISDIPIIIDSINFSNPILLIQLYFHYKTYNLDRRVFVYSKYNLLYSYIEDDVEMNKRKTRLSNDVLNILLDKIYEKLCLSLKNRIGNVYIDEKMKNISFPIKEETSVSGYKVMPKGSRIKLPNNKVIRAFTYWENVDDIDLAAIGFEDDDTMEFSWRTMYVLQSEAIVFSGDQTAGYDGGSEYFDIDINKFKEKYPKINKLVFTDVVYSESNFKNCNCKAGYMLRDLLSSGEVFEPKTVETSFNVTGNTTLVYLFAIDLVKNELIWLNVSKESNLHIAGYDDYSFLNNFYRYTDILSLYDFMKMCGNKVNDINNADIIVSDNYDVNDKEIIHSYDVEKILAILNKEAI